MRICFLVHIWFSKIQAFILFLFYHFFSKIYIARYDRQNKTQWITKFLNSVLWFILALHLQNVAHQKLKFHISQWTKVVTDSNLTLLLTIKKKKKKKREITAMLHWFSNLLQALRHRIFIFSLNKIEQSRFWSPLTFASNVRKSLLWWKPRNTKK